jgi:ribosomal protein S25
MTNQKTKKGAPKRFHDAVHTAITIEKTTMTRIRKLVNHGNYNTMNDLINRAIIAELSKTENQ